MEAEDGFRRYTTARPINISYSRFMEYVDEHKVRSVLIHDDGSADFSLYSNSYGTVRFPGQVLDFIELIKE